MDTRQFDEEKRLISAARLDDGLTPLPRLHAPTLYSLVDNVVCLIAKNSEVRVLYAGANTSAASREGNPLGADDLQSLLDERNANLCFVSRQTLTAAQRILEPYYKYVPRKIESLARQNGVDKITILPSLLSQKFWRPESMDDTLRAWVAAFDVKSLTAKEKVQFFLEKVTEGDVPAFRRRPRRVGDAPKPPLNVAGSGHAVSNALLRGSSSEAYLAMEAHAGVWAAVVNSDPLLHQRGLLTGATATFTPTESPFADVVVGVVSTPFKIRPGSEIRMFSPSLDFAGYTCTLSSLGFDPDTDQLMARLKLTQQRAEGPDLEINPVRRALAQGPSCSASLCIVDAPFQGISEVRRRSKELAENARNIKRNVPLYVSLAAEG